MSYREFIENVRIRTPARTYGTRCRLHGDVPDWLAEKLPLFGAEEGGVSYLSSGGRSLIIEGDRTYRIKGADPRGIVTRHVAASGKNIIRDTEGSAKQAPDPEYVERLLNSSLIGVFPSYINGKPWNFVTRANTRNSQRAFDAIGEAYEKRGLQVPCRFAGSIEYPNLLWDNSSLYSIIFELPDAESDLRFEEFERQFMRHLQHSSPEELREIKDDISGLYESLCKWHAFDTHSLMKARLVPSPDSFLGQNYVLAHVMPGEIGISRVDHTSTKPSVNPDEVRKVGHSFNQLYNIPVFIAQALEMARSGIILEKPRFSGYFDAAFKYQGEMRASVFPEMYRELRRFEDMLSWKDDEVEPISEKQLLEVFHRIKQIKIDEEFEAQRRLHYEEQRHNLAEKGITLEMLMQALQQRI